MRILNIYIAISSVAILLFILMIIHSFIRQKETTPERAGRTAMVKNLMLTDLCLATEARYTRNPALSDYFTAFQDHPTALEHFPSGSFIFAHPNTNHVTRN